MAEAKSALKVRWSVKEVAMLVEVWASICIAPDARLLKGEQLNKMIFERYNARCARTRQLRRSPTAVNTQRGRMTQFVKFVSDFDRNAQAHGHRLWFELSLEEQLKIDIPNEWRRQLSTFSQELYNTFKQYILPVEDVNRSAKRVKKRKMACNQRLSGQVTWKHVKVSPNGHLPCWTVQDQINLARKWGEFMEIEGLTLQTFELMTFGASCERLLLPGRSAFSAWRKIRTLVSSWRFICAFNTVHQPGWFELMETERDLLIKWRELPNNFDDIEHQVFVAMEDAAAGSGVQLKEDNLRVLMETAPLPLKPLSPLLPVSLEPTPLLPYLCTNERSEATETDVTLDNLLLEDDEAEIEPKRKKIGRVEALQEKDGIVSYVAEAELLDTVATQDIKPSPPLQAKPVDGTGTNETFESILQTHNNELRRGLQNLHETLTRETERTRECFRTTRNDTFDLSKLAKVVLAQQNRQLTSTLRLVEELYTQNGVEMRAFIQEQLSSPRISKDITTV